MLSLERRFRAGNEALRSARGVVDCVNCLLTCLHRLFSLPLFCCAQNVVSAVESYQSAQPSAAAGAAPTARPATSSTPAAPSSTSPSAASTPAAATAAATTAAVTGVGSVEAAQRELAALNDAAARRPLPVAELNTAAKNLVAMLYALMSQNNGPNGNNNSSSSSGGGGGGGAVAIDMSGALRAAAMQVVQTIKALVATPDDETTIKEVRWGQRFFIIVILMRFGFYPLFLCGAHSSPRPLVAASLRCAR